MSGIAMGILGFVPIWYASKGVDATTRLPLLRAILAVLASVSILMAGLICSLVVLLLIRNSYDHYVTFVVSLCVTYVLTVIIFAIAKMFEMRREDRERR